MFSILENNPKVLIQGITGKHGSSHTKTMLDYGTQIVAGVVPGKANQTIYEIPIFNTVKDVLDYSDIDISIIFVPPAFCKAALIEAVDAKIPLIICVTEGVPIHDFIFVKKYAKENGVRIVGPNCPGILMPGIINLGIIPTNIGLPGDIAIISRSGTLAYEAANSLTQAGIGQRIIVGIGGDQIKGLTFVDYLREFQQDESTSAILLIGEIGGHDEQIAAEYISNNITKPVFAYIAGHYAPINKQLGHAGAIIQSSDETAAAKTKLLSDAGTLTADSIDKLIAMVINHYQI
ncbi:MAG: succinate--CoA ligase subunit alpha [Candidatus Saccharibacteria bacterium]